MGEGSTEMEDSFLGLFTLVKYERCEYSLDKENGM
jgi:hypothetical protein